MYVIVYWEKCFKNFKKSNNSSLKKNWPDELREIRFNVEEKI